MPAPTRQLLCRFCNSAGPGIEKVSDHGGHYRRAHTIAEQADAVAAGAVVQPEAFRQPHGTLQLRHLKHAQGRGIPPPLHEPKSVQCGQGPQWPVEGLVSTSLVGAVVDGDEVLAAADLLDAMLDAREGIACPPAVVERPSSQVPFRSRIVRTGRCLRIDGSSSRVVASGLQR